MWLLSRKPTKNAKLLLVCTLLKNRKLIHFMVRISFYFPTADDDAGLVGSITSQVGQQSGYRLLKSAGTSLVFSPQCTIPQLKFSYIQLPRNYK